MVLFGDNPFRGARNTFDGDLGVVLRLILSELFNLVLEAELRC